jgi:hypothetical protein
MEYGQAEGLYAWKERLRLGRVTDDLDTVVRLFDPQARAPFIDFQGQKFFSTLPE